MSPKGTATDDCVLDVQHRVHQTGPATALLPEAPHHLSDALDRRDWRQLITHALHLARLGV